jgi:signal transduction histidine kinase
MNLRALASARPLRRHAQAVDVGVAAAVGLFGLAETVLFGDYHPRWEWAAGAVVTGVLLLGRRRAPLPTLVALLVALAVLDFTTHTDSDPGFPFFAVLIGCFACGAYAGLGTAVAALALALADYAVGIVIDDQPVSDLVFVSFVIVGALGLGRALAERGERLARAVADREARAEAAVQQERARIARDLHDVVAHSMSMVVLQVGAVRRLLHEDQARERETLLAVEATGREALAEMRRLLGIQRRAENGSALAPQPTLADVPDLAEHVRAAGLPVALRVEGEPVALAPGLDLSAYRIVQEALTNALKHAGPASATVVVRYGPRALELEVSDTGRGGAVNGHGHGLIGMRERAALYGGALEAGAVPGGGWRVCARLPVPA